MKRMIPIAAVAIAAVMMFVGVGYAVSYYGQAESSDNDVTNGLMEIYLTSGGERISSGLTMPHPADDSDRSQITGYGMTITMPSTSIRMAIDSECDPSVWVILHHITITLKNDKNVTYTFNLGRADPSGDMDQRTGEPSSPQTVNKGDSGTYTVVITFVYSKTFGEMTAAEKTLFDETINLVFMAGNNGVFK